MKRRILSGILFAVIIALPVGAQQAAKPLSQDQVTQFVKVGMEPAKLVQLIHDHNIDFDPSDDYLEGLRKIGAQAPVIQALRDARPKPLTKDQVLALVAQNIPGERAALLVKQRGVDFLVDDAYVENLRLAGGNDELIAAVREARLGASVLIRQLVGHTGEVDTVAFSPDGKLLASGSWDETVRLWDVVTGTLWKTIEPPQEQKSFIYSVAFSPDGKLLAVASGYNGITIWDVTSGKLEQSLSEDQHPHVYSVAFSPDGKLLAAGNSDKTVKLWDVATGRLRQTLSGHAGMIQSVAFSPDGRLLASGSWDNTIKVWEVDAGTLQQTLSGHSQGVYCTAFSPDGKLLASGGGDATVKLWDVATGALQRTLHSTSGIDIVESVAFSPEGKFLASGQQLSMIKIWEVATGGINESLSLPGQYSGEYIALSPDGKLLASAPGDRIVRIWRLKQY